MIEEWKVIQGYSKYFISNLGKVKSYYEHNGTSERILKSRLDKYGYLYVNLIVENKRKTFKIHRLVLKAFKSIKNPENFECNHIDGNKWNNNIDNLEWCTRSENMKHAVKIGLNKGFIGIKNPKHKLTEKEIKEIKMFLKKGELSQKEIGMKFGVHQVTISDIKHKRIWLYIK